MTLCKNYENCHNHGNPEIEQWWTLYQLPNKYNEDEAPDKITLCSLQCVAQYAINNSVSSGHWGR